jgi:hypothetical protein
MRAVKRFNLVNLAVLTVLAACGHKAPDQPAKPAEPVEKGSAAPPAPTPDTGTGSAEAKAPPEPPKEAPAPPPTPHEDTFIKMSKDEKTKIMKTKVMPTMAKLFKDHDAKKFGKFECKTCHGKGAGKGFKMPNPDLPKLDFQAMHEGTADKRTMDMAKWMAETIEPEMAKLLELAPFDPAHPELGGFGCLACHEQKK